MNEPTEKAEEKKDEKPAPKPKKISARKLLRTQIRARHRVYPPGSSWKRRNGSIAKAGPRYGAKPKEEEEA